MTFRDVLGGARQFRGLPIDGVSFAIDVFPSSPIADGTAFAEGEYVREGSEQGDNLYRAKTDHFQGQLLEGDGILYNWSKPRRYW